MILLDTNLVIYSLENEDLRQRLTGQQVASNWIIRAEVLSWQYLESDLEQVFRTFFDETIFLGLEDRIFERAIQIRRAHSIKLPDALIAATAVEHACELWTHNTRDFTGIAGLILVDPLD